eukprot:5005546-Prymnesium_polylepis.1
MNACIWRTVAGAGKTETAKRFLQYLAFAATQGSGRDSSDNSRLEAQVVATSPLLEAFGNAQASRSHFGSSMRICAPYPGLARRYRQQ